MTSLLSIQKFGPAERLFLKLPPTYEPNPASVNFWTRGGESRAGSENLSRKLWGKTLQSSKIYASTNQALPSVEKRDFLQDSGRRLPSVLATGELWPAALLLLSIIRVSKVTCAWESLPSIKQNLRDQTVHYHESQLLVFSTVLPRSNPLW